MKLRGTLALGGYQPFVHLNPKKWHTSCTSWLVYMHGVVLDGSCNQGMGGLEDVMCLLGVLVKESERLICWD